MKAVFIETTNFTQWLGEFMSDDAYAALQVLLMENPTCGDVMPGCGGLRKIRTADARRGKGKRGGARVIYLHVPENRWFLMLDIYGKDEKDDLTPSEKVVLADLANHFKQQALKVVHLRKKR